MRTGDDSGATILPKVITVNLAFSPIHETPLGWQQITDSTEEGENQSTVQFSSQNYPYGAVLAKSLTSIGQPASSEDDAGRDQLEADTATAIDSRS